MPRNPEEILKSFVPPISAATLRDFQRLKFSDTRVAAHFFASQFPEKICQGDVFGPLTLVWWGPGRVRVEDETFALLVSPSCDYDNDDFVLVAPVFDADRFKSQKYYRSLIQQEITSLYYLAPMPGRPALVADLGLIQSYPTAFLKEGLQSGVLARICSLSQLGWIGLLLKLTLLIARPEPEDEERGVANYSLFSRIRYGLSDITRIVRYILRGSD